MSYLLEQGIRSLLSFLIPGYRFGIYAASITKMVRRTYRRFFVEHKNRFTPILVSSQGGL